MKRLASLSIKTVLLAGMLVLLAGLLGDLVAETYGVPGWVANTLRAVLAERGLSLDADTYRAGLVRGLVLGDAHLRLDWRAMPVLATCREVRLRPRLGPLLRGRLVLQTATCEGVEARGVVGPGPGPLAGRSCLRLERARGVAWRQRDGSLAFTVEGLAEKVAVHLDGELRGPLGSGGSTSRQASRRAIPGPHPEPGPDRLRALLERLAERLASYRLKERDAFLSGRLIVDTETPANSHFDGEGGIAELTLNQLFVSRLKSAIRIRRDTLRLDGLTLILSPDESLAGDLTLDFGAGQVSGAVRGQVRPETLWRVQSRTRPGWFDRFQAPRPLDVRLELRPSPWNPSAWQLGAEVSGRELRLQGLPIAQATATATWNGHDLTVSTWRAGLDPDGQETATGQAIYHGADGTLEGQMALTCRLPERLRQAGLGGWLNALPAVDLSAPVTVQAQLERSPLAWRRWHLRGSLSTPTLSWRNRPLRRLRAEAALGQGRLRLAPVTLGFPEGPDDLLTLGLTIDLGRGLADGVWQAEGSLRLQALPGPPARTSSAPLPVAVELGGSGFYTPATGALDLAAAGTLDPGRLYGTLQPRLGLPESAVVNGIACAPEAPARVVLNLQRADHLHGLRLQAAVAAEEARYRELAFRSVAGDVELSRDGVSFSGVRAVSANGAEIGLDIDIGFQPLTVTLHEGRLVGDPNLVAHFIHGRRAQAIYRRVWQDFRWAEDRPATLSLRELAYRQGAAGHDWQLTMDATLAAEQAAYRDLTLPHLQAQVELDLPGSIHVRQAQVQTDSATVTGEVAIQVGDHPRCVFELRPLAGGIDPRRILHTVNPAWDDLLKDLTFSPASEVQCRGSFYLSRDPMLQLEGTLRTPYLEFHAQRLENPDIGWRLRQSSLHWDIRSGQACGGSLALTGVYDVEVGSGTLALQAEAMQLGQVAAALGLRAAEAMPGTVTAHSQLRFLRDWAGRDLQVYGDSTLAISQADIWRVPFFDHLGRLLDVSFLNRLTRGKASGLGRITRLDADLGFSGDRVVVRSLVTDGTLLSLRGQGEYCWDTDRINLAVTGQTLDNAGIVGWIFRPLSWAFFNAELTGTSKENRWRLVNAFTRALPGGGDEEPETPLPPPGR